MYLIENDSRDFEKKGGRLVLIPKEREIRQILMLVAVTGRQKASFVGGLDVEGR
jgi:hypothetical protein